MLENIIQFAVLWQAYQTDVFAVRHLVNVVAGKTLDCKQLAAAESHALQANASIELLDNVEQCI